MVWGRKTSFNFTMSDDSCIQCNSIVRMIRIFSGTDMIKKVPICLFERPICLIEVPNCLGTEMSRTGAEVSWCRFVPVPKCLDIDLFNHNHNDSYLSKSAKTCFCIDQKVKVAMPHIKMDISPCLCLCMKRNICGKSTGVSY